MVYGFKNHSGEHRRRGSCGKAGGSRRLPSASFPASVFHLFVSLLASVVERAEPFVERQQQHPVVHFEVPMVQIVEVVAAVKGGVADSERSDVAPK